MGLSERDNAAMDPFKPTWAGTSWHNVRRCPSLSHSLGVSMMKCEGRQRTSQSVMEINEISRFSYLLGELMNLSSR